MTNLIYDLIIIGAGPIGAATAYFLTERGVAMDKVLLLSKPDSDDHSSTYIYAGGSVQYGHWAQPIKTEMTKATAEFIKNLAKKNIDLSLIEDNYLFLDEGLIAPALNIAGAKLVNYLLDQSVEKGLNLQKDSEVLSVKKVEDVYQVKTNNQEYHSKKVFIAAGPGINNLIPDAEVKLEKRVLFVLDLPVDENRQKLPHTIIPFKDGWFYFFIKKIGDEYKVVVGQEDLVEHNDKSEEENYFNQLLEMGLAEIAPFLKDAKVEKVLWGFDSFEKTLQIKEHQPNLFSVNCGSAVRSCVYIGQKVAEKLLQG